MGASDDEIAEAVHMASSVAAGAVLAMADRAKAASDQQYYWWRPSRRQRTE